MWRATILCALLLLGCASHRVEDRIALAEQIAGQHGFSKTVMHAGRFDLTAYIGPPARGDILHVYIEGDGLAWVTRRQRSRNPTPLNPVALKLAVLDNQRAAYLARPCQYIVTLDQTCDERYWTSARFSADVIDSMDQALTQLKQVTGVTKLVLIGYSGGGTVAALAAARRTDVLHLITVAGNLNPAAWTRLHGLTPLQESLNPTDYWRELAHIRQTHFVGLEDRVVPEDVYHSYRNAFPTYADIKLKRVPDAEHNCCWEKLWPDLLGAIR